jgi:hypothetical protein
MTKDEIWAVVEYAKSLRPSSSQVASHNVEPARVFDSGITFAQFLDRATAQREVWLKNASTTDVPPDAVNRLKRVREGLRVLIVAEDWCVDSVHTVPYIANVAAGAGVDVRIVDRAAGESVASAHRTRDGRPVTPIVVLLRHDRDVGAWVERPAALQQLFFAMATSPENARQFAERATWYDEDRGRTTIAEFVALAERTARQ